MRTTIDILPNGLRVVVLGLDHVHATTCALLVKAGPRYETPATNGLSHVVEHLLFRGTRAHPSSLSFHSAVEALGGEINGMTQRDAMTLYITVPPDRTSEALRLLGESCTSPLLEGLDVERNVVIEEILDSIDADGVELDIDTISRRLLWPNHPMSMPVAGTVELVEGFTEEACRARFEELFAASNAVLVVAGPVSRTSVVTEARAAFGAMPRGTPLAEPVGPVPPACPPIHIQPTDDSQTSILLSYPAVAEDHPDFTTMLLMRRIVDDGFGARLRQAIIEQRGLAYSLSAAIDVYKDAGAFDVELTCAPTKIVRTVERALMTLREIVENGVSQAELERVKTRHLAELSFSLDAPFELCTWYGSAALLGCDVDYDKRQAAVEATTTADIQRLASAVFDPERVLLTLVGPVDKDRARALELVLQRPFESTVWLDAEAEREPERALDLAG